MHVLFEVPDSKSCCFRIFLIIVNIVVEFDEFHIFLESPLSQAVGVKIELVGLEVKELFVDKV